MATEIYCSKCKAYTDNENEEWDQKRQTLSGLCIKCGKTKYTFVNEEGYFKKKSANQKATARIKRKERTLNKKAKKLGREILNADKKVRRNVRTYLKEA